MIYYFYTRCNNTIGNISVLVFCIMHAQHSEPQLSPDGLVFSFHSEKNIKKCVGCQDK